MKEFSTSEEDVHFTEFKTRTSTYWFIVI